MEDINMDNKQNSYSLYENDRVNMKSEVLFRR